ncbi:hypothetical protein BH23VER1_BH23VER1_10130 [soil metagenome]
MIAALTEAVNREKASGGGPTVVSDFDYVNDDLGRRTDMDYAGSAFAAAAGYDYLYNARGEVAGANFLQAIRPWVRIPEWRAIMII